MYLRSYYARFRDKFGSMLLLGALAVVLFGGIVADVVSAKVLKSGYPLPGVPTNIYVGQGNALANIFISWTEPLYATYYEIWRGDGPSGPFNLVTTVNAPAKYY